MTTTYGSVNQEEQALIDLNNLPSNQSTNAATNASANATNSRGRVEMTGGEDEFLLSSNNNNSVNSSSSSRGKGRTLWFVAGAAVLVVAGLMVSGTFSPSTASSSSNQDSSSNNADNSINQQHGLISLAPPVFSTKHPVKDLKVPLFEDRPAAPNARLFASSNPDTIPTNAWYQNLILNADHPSEEQRVYPVPYVVDVVGPIAGLRLHKPTVMAGATVVQLTQVLQHGLTMGAATLSQLMGTASTPISNQYTISKMTPLGITLEWQEPNSLNNTNNTTTLVEEDPLLLTYSSSIVRGMPYATMQYNSKTVMARRTATAMATAGLEDQPASLPTELTLPTLASEIPISEAPLLDGKTKLVCSHGNQHHQQSSQIVQGELQLTFDQSDYTWIVFVSRPVHVQCIVPPPKEAVAFVPGRPVPSNGVVFALQFQDDLVGDTDTDDDTVTTNTNDLVLRVALANDCTNGRNPQSCGRADKEHDQVMNQTAYTSLLRQHADLYPGPDTDVSFEFVDTGDNGDITTAATATRLKFNWNVQSMKHGEIMDDKVDNTVMVVDDDDDDDMIEGSSKATSDGSSSSSAKLLMYALPHHQDMIEEATAMSTTTATTTDSLENQDSSFPTFTVMAVEGHDDSATEARFCKASLLGPACLVQGSTWGLLEQNKWTSFRAPRPPQNDTLKDIAKAYADDINYTLPSYYQRGAGDTYFSGKMLSKFGRILTIGEELDEICNSDASPEECADLDIPSVDDPVFQDALARLRSGVEIWINGTGETPFVYDPSWGGYVSCGCNFDDSETEGLCHNRFPDCPGFYDPGLNFGNAWYNDNHFHLGYHIYGAAVVAHFDPKWGRDHFEQVLLLIRNIANPSTTDTAFPTFRHKDWYQGSSWASGIAVSPLNGRNQESSSESIMSYEAVALYGKEMVQAWKGHGGNNDVVAQEVYNYGQLLCASELRSADRYWHVIDASTRRQYPREYKPHVIGILWNMMAQFQTWFGGSPYLAIGIQLLPLTAVSEERDTMEWAREMYEPFDKSCNAAFQDCRDNGWSILVLAILATVGHPHEAIEKTLKIPSTAFTSAGGNGHSLTNTLWYLATRPQVIDPLILDPSKKTEDDTDMDDVTAKKMHPQSGIDDINGPAPQPLEADFDCGCPKSCSAKALGRFAVGHTCGDRISWLMTQKANSEFDACHQTGVEFPGHCAACDPKVCSEKEPSHSKTCPPCSQKICQGKLNLCPVDNAPFLCTDGASIGGCSRSPWPLGDGYCEHCCELSYGCEDE